MMKDAQDNMGWTANMVKTLACVGLDSAGIEKKKTKKRKKINHQCFTTEWLI